jgi:hypothetical protein
MTTVSDFVIWTKHIHGDSRLAARIADMAPGETIDLRIAGEAGVWRKMDDGKDGRPTPGLRPIGKAQDAWRQLYRSRRGEGVTLEAVEGMEEAGAPFIAMIAITPPAFAATDRQAALQAFLELAGQGWRSQGRRLDRDALHDRGPSASTPTSSSMRPMTTNRANSKSPAICWRGWRAGRPRSPCR